MKAAIQQAIIDNLAQGRYLSQFCGKKGIPSHDTVQRFQAANAEFASQCARAREASAWLHEAAVKEISDKTLKGVYAPDAARVAINAETWLAKVRAPKVYGDKATTDVNLTARVEVVERVIVKAKD